MSKYYILGAFLTLATWSGTYAPTATSMAGHFQLGGAAQAGVRWTPNPERGSASSTLSGGRRSAAASACALDSALLPDPAITLLVPNGETGLTVSSQPTLSWYLESESVANMEFVLSHPEQAAPVYTKRLSADTGLVEVTLPDSAALEEGVRYRWTVFVTCNGGENEIHARSFVERVAPGGLLIDMVSLPAAEKAEAYAANGIWYDALNTLVNAYRSESQISTLLDIRDLLEQAQTDVPLELSLATSSQQAVN
ncbi:MAG: DUF928 domain-containing protein [Cyanobacteria bacterium J06598_1]